MLAQRGSRPDDKSQRSVQLRAPIQAQLKSPTWGNEEDDGPMAHPPAVSRYKTRPSLTRVGEAPPALPTAPLDWTTPSCTLPRAPTRQGGPTRGGSPLRPRLLPGQRRKHLGSQHNGAHRPPWTRRASRQAGYSPSVHGGTIRLNNWDLRRCPGPTTKHPRSSVDPRGNPARAPIERGAASAQAIPAAQALGHRTAAVHTRTPPDSSGSDKTTGQRSCTSGRPYGKGNRPSHTTQPQATATNPPAYPTQGRAKAHSRQGNPLRTKSNGSADCLNNRATPSADRALTGRAAGTPQGSEPFRARRINATARPTPLRSTPTPPTAGCIRRNRAPASFGSAGSQRSSATPNPEYPAKSQRAPPNAQGKRLTDNRYRPPWIATPSPPLKQRRRPGKQVSEGDKQEKSKKANLWELNAHVGLGQPRTRHHAQSGRSGHPSDTVPLA
ncbi:hypothetical protein WOLCODRAFT_159462 [Wolfiporia cocos MD-104 SS10]|uniref:Uncharacterized protein n=1 Tax=Wolfiporia cocos (strain MD-104) TaxID=742152 RepID=A0A2H3JGI5_WOLCO|nr:hypothetical protein WOLCODRAFT_159462 [Wolfiporia cocos MD-104 SS10]